MLGLGLVAAAHAGPFWALQPAGTMPTGENEFGAAFGYHAALEDYGVGDAVFSAWSRYGLSDRFEVMGGAWVPAWYDLGLHANVRALLVGDPTDDGLRLVVGGGIGVPLGTTDALQLAVPVTFGVRVDQVEIFGGPDLSWYPLIGLFQPAAELGGMVEVSNFPVYALARYERLRDLDLLQFQVGFAYNLAI